MIDSSSVAGTASLQAAITVPDTSAALAGRGEDLEVVRLFVGAASDRGGALLLSGEPGVGKSVLLDAAVEMARAAGTRVLRASGAEFEADISFCGLNQLLLPLAAELGRLSALHRNALNVALGLSDGLPSDRLVVSNAALALLRQGAAAGPLLVVVDDLPWLDRASAVVLGFVARRLAGSRVGFLAASRPEAESFFDRGGLPCHEVRPLGKEAAASLLGERFPDLATGVRQRVVDEARGSPLALLELPAALSGPQRCGRAALPAMLPLSRRLQALFTSRVSDLPARTRYLLLLAVLEGTGDLGVVQAAAGRQREIDDLAPAERAGLVRVDEDSGRLAFWHPLTRSAIVELSASDDQRRAHRALAAQLSDQPDRRVRHLAHATAEPDEEVASLLEQAAREILHRGDAAAAADALRSAARLSPQGADRGRRLAEVAFISSNVTGELGTVPQLLADVRLAEPEFGGSLHAATAAAQVLLNGDGDIDTAHRLLVGAIGSRAAPYDAGDATLTGALQTLLTVCWFGGRAELWEPLHTAMARLTPHVPPGLYLLAQTHADPARSAASVLDQVDAAIARLPGEIDHWRILTVSAAAYFIDRLADCREALLRVIRSGPAGGAVLPVITAMNQLCFDDFITGRWDEAQRLADQCLRACQSRGYPLRAWLARDHRAILAAARGDDETVQAETDEILRWAVPRGIVQAKMAAHHARSLAALGRGDFEDAYQQAAAISPPGVLASHVPYALRVPMDLVEAAVRTGRRDQAAAHVAAMRQAGIAAISPRLAALTAASAAIAAPALQASMLFEEALAVPGADRWPFEHARVQLAYGEHLRRARATADARAHLNAALATFRVLGARPWATRAHDELRATGLGAARAEGHGPVTLTAQERQIGALAASGLTNKQIGQRLFLSHRTVADHLYQLFPKLGITSRAALRDALAALPPNQDHRAGQPFASGMR